MDLAALLNLLGTDQPDEDTIKAFQRATPASAQPLHGMYFTPYQERLALGESQPFAETISLKDYINAVNKALAVE